ncbi:MAG: hypothetical protein IJ302_07945 [Clostridia bacterium]|nr:hypothetical protein [Clostridia bacterium]
MRDNKYVLNTALAVILFAVLLAAVLVRTFAPAVILPRPGIPGLVLLSLSALLADAYLAPGAARSRIGIPLLSALTFALLPYAAGFVTPLYALKLALIGAAVFSLTTLLFSAAQDRISSGPHAKAASLLTAMGIFLASCCFSGWIL